MFRSAALESELARAMQAARGREIAGLLLQDASGEQRIRLFPNLLSEPGALEVPRWWVDRAIQRVDPAGFRPVAFFHSHLSTLELSATDCASMRGLSLPWIVLLMRQGKLHWAVHVPADGPSIPKAASGGSAS